MSNQIKTIATSAAASWTEALTIDGASGDLVFHAVGGTFSDGNTQKTVSPANGQYTVSLTGQPPTDMGTTQIVSLYYELNGWQIAQQGSRILVLPQTREIDYRIQRSGFGVLPKGATLRNPYAGLAIVGETKIPSGTDFKNAFQSGLVKAVSQMASGLFDTTKSPFIAHDRTNGVVYFINAAATLAQMTVGSTLEDLDNDAICQVFERLNTSTSAREFVVFYRSGRVEVYDKGMNFLSQADTTITNTQRVVYRRRNVGLNGTADTYVVFDDLGTARYLSATFAVTSTLTDQFYTDASDSYPVLCTRSGRLVGSNVSNAPQGFAFYQFVPGTLIAVGVNAATGSICQFNIRDNSLYAPSRTLVQDNRVVYNAAADWSPSGVGITGGLDTDGTNDFIRFADGTNTSFTDTSFSYLGIYGTPYFSDSSARRFYAVARPTQNLQHLNLRDYTATIPQYDQAGGTNVAFTLTVATGDPDIPLEIRFPEGVTWTATVNSKQVKYVKDGDVVTFNVSHPNITQHSFAFTIGRSSGLFELQPDTLPDAFSFANVSGIAEGEVYDTEEITITGINVKVPVSVTVNGKPASDNVQIFIDGVEATEPFMIANNGKLRLEVLHEGDTSNVVVTVGSGSSSFGIFTVAEPILNTIRNWAYQAKGVEIVSDAITNPGPQRIILTLTDSTSALFANGTKTVTLQTGQSAQIKFTPEENKQYHVVFNTEQHQYDWQVWTDAQWLDPQPATQRAERYVLGDSGDIKFNAIPQNFYTNIRVPAGILLQINQQYVDLPLDVRGVYKEQTSVLALECSKTTLRMEGLPSHNQPHTIRLGDARLEWLYDFTVDPTYQAIADVYVGQSAPQFVAVVHDVVQQPAQQYIAAATGKRTDVDQQHYSEDSRVVYTDFDRNFVTARPLLDAEFLSRFEPHLDGVVSSNFDQQYIGRVPDSSAAFDTSLFVAAWRNLAVEYATNEFESSIDFDSAVQQFSEFETGIDYLDAQMDLPAPRTVPWIKPNRAVMPQAHYRTSGVSSQIDNKSRARWVKISAGIGQSNDRANLVRPNHTWIDGAVASVVVPKARIDIPIAEPNLLSTTNLISIEAHQPLWHAQPATYHLKNGTPRWTHIPRVTFRYSMNVGIQYKHKAYPVSMKGRTVGKTRTYKLGLKVRYVWDIVHRPETSDFSRIRAYLPFKLVAAKPEKVTTPPTYKQHTSVGQVKSVELRAHIAMQNRRVSDVGLLRIDGSISQYVPVSAVQQIDTARPEQKQQSVIAVTRSQPQRVVVKTIHIPQAVLEVPDTPIDYGEQDPIKQGYFATELDALQNATQVWGHDPTAVYAIKQPNGYWTWAVVVTCENVCGSYGCDTRGYLSGG